MSHNSSAPTTDLYAYQWVNLDKGEFFYAATFHDPEYVCNTSDLCREQRQAQLGHLLLTFPSREWRSPAGSASQLNSRYQVGGTVPYRAVYRQVRRGQLPVLVTKSPPGCTSSFSTRWTPHRLEQCVHQQQKWDNPSPNVETTVRIFAPKLLSHWYGDRVYLIDNQTRFDEWSVVAQALRQLAVRRYLQQQGVTEVTEEIVKQGRALIENAFDDRRQIRPAMIVSVLCTDIGSDLLEVMELYCLAASTPAAPTFEAKVQELAVESLDPRFLQVSCLGLASFQQLLAWGCRGSVHHFKRLVNWLRASGQLTEWQKHELRYWSRSGRQNEPIVRPKRPRKSKQRKPGTIVPRKLQFAATPSDTGDVGAERDPPG